MSETEPIRDGLDEFGSRALDAIHSIAAERNELREKVRKQDVLIESLNAYIEKLEAERV